VPQKMPVSDPANRIHLVFNGKNFSGAAEWI
jgi:hypothetical protein